MKFIYIIVIFIILLLIIKKNIKTKEGFPDSVNDEAIMNIASIYNTSELYATNIRATNGLSVGGPDFVVGSNKDRGDCGNCRALVHSSDNKLILNNDSDFASVHVDSGLSMKGNDFVMGTNKGRGDCGYCRALVHGDNNTLSVNFANDFGGGTDVGGPLRVNGSITGNIPIKDKGYHAGGNRTALDVTKTCPPGTVVCGLRFIHDVHSPWWGEDISLKCCKPGEA